MTPTCFGRYVLIERIASGGMGEIFVAVPKNLWGYEKYFAIKKILPSLCQEPEFLSRFRDEARLVIPMNHPNVVQVYEIGRVNDEYFIAMEWVDGQNLGQILYRCTQLNQKSLPIPAALYIIREILVGLDYCHHQTDAAGRELGLIHRDVSPSNILISYDGAIKLTDFGLALSRYKHVRTKPNRIFGHLGYISPEALEGRPLDRRADIFSAGVLLFELLTGKRFFPESDMGMYRKILAARCAIRPSSFREGIPVSIDETVTKAIAIRPEDRFSSAIEFYTAVQRQLIQMDPYYGARQLGEMIVQRLFDPNKRKRRLSALIKSLDIEALEEQQPAGRTICIGEAIPLGLGETSNHAKNINPIGLLTLEEDSETLFDGDTQPLNQESREHQSSRESFKPSPTPVDEYAPRLLIRDPHRRSRRIPSSPLFNVPTASKSPHVAAARRNCSVAPLRYSGNKHRN